MMFPLIPIGITAIFIVYVLYLLFIKKDTKQLKPVLSLGGVFIALWGVIYALWFR
jgi:hypothetical protein